MRSISLQLHCTSADILAFLAMVPVSGRGELLAHSRNVVQGHLDWSALDAGTLGVDVVNQWHSLLLLPPGVHAENGEGLDAINSRCAPLTIGMPEILSAEQCEAIMTSSPGAVMEPGLRDVMIGAVDRSGEYAQQMKAWRSLLNRFRRDLVKGAEVWIRSSPPRFYPNSWATPAAVDLAKSGVQLGIANSLLVRFVESKGTNDC